MSPARCRARSRARASHAHAAARLSGGAWRSSRARRVALEYDDLFGGPARVLAGERAGLDLFVLDAPHLYDRPGNPYLGPDGLRLARQCAPLRGAGRVGADIGLGAIAGFQPGRRPRARLAGGARARLSALTTAGRGPATVMTIHNLAFQGHFPCRLFVELGLPATSAGRSTASNISAASAISRPACSLPTASPPSRRPMRARS